jgi:hypothetical protein
MAQQEPAVLEVEVVEIMRQIEQVLVLDTIMHLVQVAEYILQVQVVMVQEAKDQIH